MSHQTQLITMVGAATYYFSSTKYEKGSGNISLGWYFAHVKHMGSLAVGSGISATLALARALKHAAAKKQQDQTAAVAIMNACIECCLACIEDAVYYLNRNAYAYMAISG